jgi:TraY domain
MHVMAKRKPKEPKARVSRRTGVPIMVWIPPELRDALDVLKNRTRRSLTTEVVMALETHLQSHNLWPSSEKESR